MHWKSVSILLLCLIFSCRSSTPDEHCASIQTYITDKFDCVQINKIIESIEKYINENWKDYTASGLINSLQTAFTEEALDQYEKTINEMSRNHDWDKESIDKKIREVIEAGADNFLDTVKKVIKRDNLKQGDVTLEYLRILPVHKETAEEFLTWLKPQFGGVEWNNGLKFAEEFFNLKHYDLKHPHYTEL